MAGGEQNEIKRTQETVDHVCGMANKHGMHPRANMSQQSSVPYLVVSSKERSVRCNDAPPPFIVG